MKQETQPRPSVRYFSPDGLAPLDWKSLFPRPAPVEVDVGCGKGRFLLARASAHPDVNYLGIERRLQRIRRVDRKVVRRELDNVRLFRMEAYYAITYLMPAASVRAYYIFFPDPWPKKKHHDHRLFNARFREAIHRTLEAGGLLHFATDHLPYFEVVEAELRGDPDRFTKVIPAFEPGDEEKTDFELLYLGKKPIARTSYRKRDHG